MAKVVMYTKANCPYCDHAKDLLNAKKVSFEEIHVDQSQESLEEMMRLSGRRTVPQIFINDQAIGGFDDLAKLAETGELNNLLK
jgi:glutaredoxin 3